METFNNIGITNRIDNFEYIELIINIQNGVGTVTIPDQPKLRYAPVAAIETYTVNEMAVSPQSGTPVVDYDTIKNGFLTLYNEQYNEEGAPWGFKEGVNRIPLSRLYSFAQGTNPYTFYQSLFKGQVVQWDKCYITFPVAQDFASKVAIVLGVYYPSTDFQHAVSR